MPKRNLRNQNLKDQQEDFVAKGQTRTVHTNNNTKEMKVDWSHIEWRNTNITRHALEWNHQGHRKRGRPKKHMEILSTKDWRDLGRNEKANRRQEEMESQSGHLMSPFGWSRLSIILNIPYYSIVFDRFYLSSIWYNRNSVSCTFLNAPFIFLIIN